MRIVVPKTKKPRNQLLHRRKSFSLSGRGFDKERDGIGVSNFARGAPGQSTFAYIVIVVDVVAVVSIGFPWEFALTQNHVATSVCYMV